MYFCGKKIRLETVFILITITTGLIYSIIFPFGEIPDEFTNYMSAYRLANQIQGVYNCRVEGEYKGFKNVYYVDMEMRVTDDVIFAEDSCQFPQSAERIDFSILSSETDYYLREDVVIFNYFPFPNYIIPAIVIVIGRLLHLSGYALVSLVRIVNLLIYTAVGYYAIKIVPIKKLMLFVFGTMPMGISYAVSANYNALLYALVLLYIAYVMYLAYSSKIIDKRKILLLFFLTLMLAPQKGAFIFFPFLVLLIPRECFDNNKTYYFTIAATIVIAVCIWGGYNFSVTDTENIVSSASGKRYVDSEGIGEAVYLTDIFSNPWHYLVILIKSMLRWGFFIRDATSTYAGIGEMASLGLISLFFFSAIVNIDEDHTSISSKNRVLVGLIYILSYLLYSFLALFGWGHRDWDWIPLKGHYVYPMLPLIGLFLSNNYIIVNSEKIRRRICDYTVIAMIFFSFAGMLWLIKVR